MASDKGLEGREDKGVWVGAVWIPRAELAMKRVTWVTQGGGGRYEKGVRVR